MRENFTRRRSTTGRPPATLTSDTSCRPLSEGFAVSLVEAMACGLVAIVSSLPGAREIAVDGQNALLARPADPGAIVNSLGHLVADPSLLQRLRLNAHRTAQSFGWHTVVAEQLRLYEEHLACPRPRR
jgi:glycosyltransferase involved in cell wall biosynthesis